LLLLERYEASGLPFPGEARPPVAKEQGLTVQRSLVNQSIRKWLFIRAGFGAGTILTAALIIGVFMSYSSREKPWNEKAISASFSADLYTVDENCNIIGMEIQCLLENRTSADYRLPEQTFMILENDGLGPSGVDPFFETAG
jgi:hypothetical protein